MATSYIGAVDPNDDWTRKPWTTYGPRAVPTTTTTVPANTTTTTIPTTTTTTPAGPCPATQVLGAQSRELDTLRAFRDNVMGHSLKGVLYTRLYYYNAGEGRKLGNPYDVLKPDFRPNAGSPATDGTVPVAAPPAGNGFIVATNYIGAVDPNDDWTRKPWTTYGVRGRFLLPPQLLFLHLNVLIRIRMDTQLRAASAVRQTAMTPVQQSTLVLPRSAETVLIITATARLMRTALSCPATQALGEDNPQLDILRELRDTIMAKSLKGKLYTMLYYYYAVKSRLLTLMKALRRIPPRRWIPCCRLSKAATSSGAITLSDEQKAQILPVLDRISSKASFGLRLIIRKVQRDLSSGDIL